MKLECVEWSEDVARGLRDTFIDYTAEEVADAVRKGHITVVRADNGSYGLVGKMGDVLLAWAFQGADSPAFFDELREICKRHQLRAIRFVTLHKGLGRLLRRHSPQLVCEENGFKTYEVIA